MSPLHHALRWALAATLAVVAVVVLAAWWLGIRNVAPSPGWSAQVLGGPSVTMGQRISPGGRRLAFQVMVDGLMQVAVMNTHSGDWTVLTKNRSRGYVTELNWSTDGSEIYFDRDFSVPQGH